jgi:hypothetical protein
VNNFGVWFDYIPQATGQSNVYLFSLRYDGLNYLAISKGTASRIDIRKVTAGVSDTGNISLGGDIISRVQVHIAHDAINGLQFRIKIGTSSWTAWTVFSTTTAKSDMLPTSSYAIGNYLNTQQAGGYFPFLGILTSLDPKADLEKAADLYPTY